MRIAYFDCFCGAGGDMIAAALLDAGLDADFLKDQLASLGIADLDIKITQVNCGSLRAVQFQPTSSDTQQRGLKRITQMIESSAITERAKQTSVEIFNRLARAEAAVHGKEIEQIHFHEVGAVDSIVDIVSAAIGLDALQIEKVYCSTLRTGGGTVETAHGTLPVPAPATAELIKAVPAAGGPVEYEILTPTAAAVLTTVVEQFGQMPAMKIEHIGCGAGTRRFDSIANILRVFIGTSAVENENNSDTVCVLETNIDDISGEIIGYTVDKLLDAGCLDVYTEPIYMKKNRPAVRLSIICRTEDTGRIEVILFKQGITFGLRKQQLQRSVLARDFVTVDTEFGKIRIKLGLLDGKIVNFKPEFSDCAAAAEKQDVAVKAVLQAAVTAYNKSN